MDRKSEKFPSTFTIDNFSSTTTLTPNEIKIPIGSKNNLSEKPYDPFEHRKLEHPNTFSGALIHIVKSSLGTGILSVPFAFQHVGLVVGFFGTLLVGFLCTHTIQILVKASQKMCVVAKVPSLGFADTAQAVFKYGPMPLRPWSNFARLFVDIALVLTYFTGNAVYIVFIGKTMKEVCDFYFPDHPVSETTIMLCVMVGLIFFCQVRPLKFLVPFSAIANVTMVVAFCITFYYMFKKVTEVDIKDISAAKGLGGIPKFLVTVLFAMEGIGSIMPVENSLLKPNFIGCPGVLNIAMSFVVFMYASMGFFGYYIYGEATDSTITSNIPHDEGLAVAGKACICVAVFFTFMLQFYVPMEISWRNIHGYFSPKYYNLIQIIWRIIAVIFITVIALSVPDLGTIIDLVGAIFFSTLGLLIPAVLDIVVNWKGGFGKFFWVLYKDILIVGIALFALISGTYFGISDLVSK